MLISRRTHTYSDFSKDIYIGLILILVLRILYLYYRAYTCISDLIIVLQSLFLYFRSYTCISDLILVLWSLLLYFGSYTCIKELILVLNLILVQILFSNHFLSFSFRVSVCDFTYGYRSQHSRQTQLLNPVLFVIQ